MTALAITRVTIPATPDGGTSGRVEGPASATDFLVCHALLEAHEREKWGNLDRCPTLAEDMEFWRGSEYEERQLFIARHGRETVGTCSVRLPLRENTATAGINVLVSPPFRRQGWGRRLLEHAEAVALGRGRTSLDGYCEEDWDPGRVRHEEQSNSRGGVQVQVATALHKSSGQLVAYTVLNWRPGVPASITQQDTLVTGEHRGKKLGLLIKAANLRAAQDRWPAARSVLTWNAVENQHMLAINTMLGFTPAGYEGEWQKRLG